ncbi:hypothetical protein JNB11_01540 [Kocuria palustris]|nr:hypothetical protein [Kocuria palustris]
MLKVDYIDVNLNNSRKLMGNINQLGETTDHAVDNHQALVDALAPLQVVNHELAWLTADTGTPPQPSPAPVAAASIGENDSGRLSQ